MKILAISDLHHHPDLFGGDLSSLPVCDVLLVVGGLTTDGSSVEWYKTALFLRAVIDKCIANRVVLVAGGNDHHANLYYHSLLKAACRGKSVFLENQVLEVDGVDILGLSSQDVCNQSCGYVDSRKMAGIIAGIKDSGKVDVIASYVPPVGFSNRGRYRHGSRNLGNIDLNPSVFVIGHNSGISRVDYQTRYEQCSVAGCGMVEIVL
jgi:predicted phosphodiesterase